MIAPARLSQERLENIINDVAIQTNPAAEIGGWFLHCRALLAHVAALDIERNATVTELERLTNENQHFLSEDVKHLNQRNELRCTISTAMPSLDDAVDCAIQVVARDGTNLPQDIYTWTRRMLIKIGEARKALTAVKLHTEGVN